MDSPEALTERIGVKKIDPEATQPENPFTPLPVNDFMALQIPPRERLLGPWLLEKSTAMIYGERGVGKTWVSLAVAAAVATGGRAVKWEAPKPLPVLYVDGEMATFDLQARLKTVLGGSKVDDDIDLRILASDHCDKELPCLTTPAGRELVLGLAANVKLVVLDNIATLVRSGKSNDADDWRPMQSLALELRRQGVATLFIHHAGKNGGQRGSSAREDALDTVIRLSRPDDYEASEGVQMKVEFTKNRHFAGPDARTFEAAYDPAAGSWSTQSGNSPQARAIELFRAGLNQKRVAEELGKSESTVSRWIKQARDAGELQSQNSGV